MGFADDNVLCATVRKFLPYPKVYVIPGFQFFAVWPSRYHDTCFPAFVEWEHKKRVFFDIPLDNQTVLHGAKAHFLPFEAGF
jgi:hypothetical protein